MHYLFRIVRDPRLRRILDSDYRELHLALQNDMSKACLVLSGGIVEAVLIDYLQVVGYEHPPRSTPPVQMYLRDLISACEAEGALTAETVSLCRVLQGYRNLVHPGRVAREEDPVSSAQVKIAATVVERVCTDIGERERKRPEWAADTIVDSADDPFLANAALERGVMQLPVSEAERLLLELLPDRLREVSSPKDDEGYWAPVCGYRTCFGAALKLVAPEAKRAAAEALLAVLEAAGPYDDGEMWVEAFFFPELLDSLDPPQRRSMAGRTVWLLNDLLKRGVRPSIDGVGQYVEPMYVGWFVKALARSYLDKDADMRRYARDVLLAEVMRTPDDCRPLVLKNLEDLVKALESSGKNAHAERLAELRYEIEPPRDEDLRP